MTDVRGLAVQAVALSVLAKRVSARSDQVKAELAGQLDPGDRKTAALDSGVKVGSITYSVGKTTARVVNPSALAEWVLANYPDEVVPTVRDSFLNAILAATTAAGVPMAPDGTLDVPGIELGTSRPYLSVRPDPATVDALVEAIRANEVLALEPAPADSGQAA